ncbi:MAG: hypothetical protein IT534_06610 [Bauldia sp.]|jgi:hypothetical protein|nr:hypothetical protein [Bauldia sp.]
MTPTKLAAVIVFALVAAATPLAAQTPAEPTWLVVAQGQVVELRPGMIILAAPAKAVAFTDRPDRMVAMIDLRGFTGTQWGEGGPFVFDPPNASIIGDDGQIAIVEITDALYDNGQLHLTVVLLDGTVPDVGGHVGITIDAFPTAVNATGGAAA